MLCEPGKPVIILQSVGAVLILVLMEYALRDIGKESSQRAANQS